MKKFNNLILALFIIGLLVQTVSAEVKLPSLFADNMVLQQQSEASIWGWGSPKSKITLVTSWNNLKNEIVADANGKWKIKIKTPVAGGPYDIKISGGNEIVIKNILIGEVWLCSGQSNMEMPMKGFRGQPIIGFNEAILKSKNEKIRLITVPRSSKIEVQDNFEGKWEMAEPKTVAEFSATAYFYGRLLNEILDVPVGLICVSYGGSCIEAWMSSNTTEIYEGVGIPKPGDTLKAPNRTPSVLFNNMLSPVIGYTIKGVIWYQGETNYINAEKYTRLFSTMVKEWRELWEQGEFPFYYMQIAPFDYKIYKPNAVYQEKFNSAYLREAQLKALDVIPNCGMAVLMDIGEEFCIHPSDKKTGGERLAYISLAQTYGIEGIGYNTPTVKEAVPNDTSVVISFDNMPNGLTSYGKEITTFEIAGEDRIFHPAKAILRSKSVIVYSQDVKKPVAVRYAFKDFVKGELFSNEGIPVSSFRTDNW